MKRAIIPKAAETLTFAEAPTVPRTNRAISVVVGGREMLVPWLTTDTPTALAQRITDTINSNWKELNGGD